MRESSMQFSLLSRIKEYYTDLKCEKHHELFRPGNVLWVLALIPIMVAWCCPFNRNKRYQWENNCFQLFLLLF